MKIIKISDGEFVDGHYEDRGNIKNSDYYISVLKIGKDEYISRCPAHNITPKKRYIADSLVFERAGFLILDID